MPLLKVSGRHFISVDTKYVLVLRQLQITSRAPCAATAPAPSIVRILMLPLETHQGWLASTQRAAMWRWNPPPTVKCPLEALPPSWAVQAGMSMMLVSALLECCVWSSAGSCSLWPLWSCPILWSCTEFVRLDKRKYMWSLLHVPLWSLFFPQPVPDTLPSYVSLPLFFLPPSPNCDRADSERPAGAQWNGHRILPEPLRPSPQQPHPQPLWHTTHASQPHAHTPTASRKPQLSALEGTLSSGPLTACQHLGNIQPPFNQRPSLCLCVCSIRYWHAEMEGQPQLFWTLLSLAPSLVPILLPRERKGGR